MSEQLDEFTDLLGAYALDAVDPDERQAIEDHLAACPRCRAEVAEHIEVAGFLTQFGAAAPDGVWDRIVAELSPPAPPLRLSFSPSGPDEPLIGHAVPAVVAEDNVVPLAARRRSVAVRTFVAVVSAAAVIVAVLAVITVNQSHRLDKMEAAVDDVSMDRLANRAVGRAEVQVRLEGDVGGAEAVVARDGQGYLITDGLPATTTRDVYQLWGKVDGRVLSLGTFDGDTTVVPFRLDPNRLDGIQAFAVTKERAPGVVASTQQPVVAGTT